MLPGGPLCVDSFEDLDRVAGPELDDRLLPARLLPALQAAALRLRLHLGDVDAQHLDAEELLDRLPDLRLVRVRVDAERIRVAALDLRVALLGHDRGEQNFVGVKAHRTSSFSVSFPSGPVERAAAARSRSPTAARTLPATPSSPVRTPTRPAAASRSPAARPHRA